MKPLEEFVWSVVSEKDGWTVGRDMLSGLLHFQSQSVMSVLLQLLVAVVLCDWPVNFLSMARGAEPASDEEKQSHGELWIQDQIYGDAFLYYQAKTKTYLRQRKAYHNELHPRRGWGGELTSCRSEPRRSDSRNVRFQGGATSVPPKCSNLNMDLSERKAQKSKSAEMRL